MQTVLLNAVILEGKDLEPIKGFLVIKDGEIARISSGAPSKGGIDMKNAILIPPFVNSHTHIGDAAGAELYLGRGHEEVVGPGGVKFRIFEKISKNLRKDAMAKAIADMKKLGTIAHVDFREEGIEGIKLLKQCADATTRSIILGRGETDREIEGVLQVADGVGLPSVKGMPPEKLKELSNLVKGKGKLLAAHVAEEPPKKTGVNEVKIAADAGMSFVVHATHCTQEDLEILKRKKIPVVFCCRSNLLLHTGVPPIAKAIEMELDFFLGTDNVMVCRPSMLEELHFAIACARLKDSKIGAEEARKILISATIKPAEYFGLSGGVIEEGAEATFLVLARGSNLLNLKDIHAGIVNRAGEDNLKAFFVKGKNILEET
ncbi:MAG: amidohydrolase family protein [Candidatus Hadarchaeales archaeon]